MPNSQSAEFRALRQQTGVPLTTITERFNIGPRTAKRWEEHYTPRPEALEYLRSLLVEDNTYLQRALDQFEKVGTKKVTLHKYRGPGHYYAAQGRRGVLSWERRERREQRLISLLYLKGFEIEYDYYPDA